MTTELIETRYAIEPKYASALGDAIDQLNDFQVFGPNFFSDVSFIRLEQESQDKFYLHMKGTADSIMIARRHIDRVLATYHELALTMQPYMPL